MPTLTPELKKLDYFAGTWVLEGEMKPGPMSSGGKMRETNRNQWMDGGFFLIVRSEFETPMGNGSGFAYMGYDPKEKIYTYDEFNSMGDAIHSRGAVDGDKWTWSGERKTDSGISKTRWVVKLVSPASYDFKFEISSDGMKWNTVMDGRATKQQ
jgi:hypothetical protein